MLVDVVCLRQGGLKLPTERVKACTPTRGVLTIQTEPWREQWAPNQAHELLSFARLRPSEGGATATELLPALRKACVNKLLNDDLVIVGLERTSHELCKEKDEPQAWWCKLVTTSACT